MADLPRSVPKPDQLCPICGARLPAGTLYCERCGSDLSRAGMVLSSDVRPVSRRRLGPGALLGRRLLPGVVVLVLLLAVAGLPAVGARVPVLGHVTGPIGEALSQVWTWGAGLVSSPSTPSKRPSAPRAVIEPAAQPAPSPVPPAGSYLIVRSTPDGADVYVNTERAGRTPLVLKDLQPGTYRVRVTRAGYVSSARMVELGRNSGLTMAVRLRPVQPSPATPPAASPAPPPKAPPAGSAAAAAGLALGSPAPGFALKDRLGVIYRLSDYSGRGVVLLFVWELDAAGKHAVRTLNARRGGREAFVIMLRPDRVALRRFIGAERITLPMLFGDARIAAAYRVPSGVPLLYVISETGQIAGRQVARQ